MLLLIMLSVVSGLALFSALTAALAIDQLAQLTGNSPIHVPVGGKTSLDNTPVSGEDSGRKREVRLMKNRLVSFW